MLDAIERHESPNAYCAVEFGSDVSVKDISNNEASTYFEEDKNYDPDVTFTLMSTEVKNTLVIFLDCWAHWHFSRHVYFGFYTPNNIGTEKNTQNTKRLSLAWPDEPVLKLLAAGQIANKEVLTCVKTVVLDEYRTQYNDPKNPGHFSTFEAWADDAWTDFLRRIQWKFGQENEVVLENTILNKIKASTHYHEGLAGKEKYIVAAMLDLLDKRQSKSDPLARSIHSSDVLLIFRDVGAGRLKLPDPAWKTWESLQKPDDTRNLQQKVEAVGDGLGMPVIRRWSRAASNSFVEQDEMRQDKSVLSLKYQVYDACEAVLAKLIESHGSKKLPPDTIEKWIEELVAVAQKRLKDRSTEYNYPAGSDDFIRGLVWALIDSCFLSFDTGGVHV